MKKSILLLGFTLLSVSYGFSQQAESSNYQKNQTNSIPQNLNVQQILDFSINAYGGREKLESIKTVKYDTSSTIMLFDIKGTVKKMAPNKYIVNQTIMGENIVICWDGEKGYMISENKKGDLPPDVLKSAKKSSIFEILTIKASDVKSVSEIKEDKKDCYLLKTDEMSYYIDKSTGLLYKSVSSDKSILNTYKEYSTIDGIKFSTKFNTPKGNVDISNVVLNKDVSLDDFK